MPGLGSCRGKSANPDAVRVLRHVPRHDMVKAQQVKIGDFTPHGGKLLPKRSDFALHGARWLPNSSDFAFNRPHRPTKGVRIMPRSA
jgi:hypothetical protein